jgi:hypothetical protein
MLSRWCRNVDLLSIAYAFRPRLRDRLTLSGRTFLRKPWTYGESDSRGLCRYLCRQGLFRELHRSLRYGFAAHGMLLYPSRIAPESRSFGGMLEPRWIVGPESLDQ